jgi:hypothetical protein
LFAGNVEVYSSKVLAGGEQFKAPVVFLGKKPVAVFVVPRVRGDAVRDLHPAARNRIRGGLRDQGFQTLPVRRVVPGIETIGFER